MDSVFDLLIHVLAYRVGVRVLRFLSGGRFKGASGYAWGCALLAGSAVLLAPSVVVIGWLVFKRAG